jgi:hypothetical protein
MLEIMRKVSNIPIFESQSKAPNVRAKLNMFLKIRRHVKASTAISPETSMSNLT